MSGSRRLTGKRKLFCLAQREKIAQSAHANGFDDIIMADTFEEAFEQCVKYAKPGDAVLYRRRVQKLGDV